MLISCRHPSAIIEESDSNSARSIVLPAQQNTAAVGLNKFCYERPLCTRKRGLLYLFMQKIKTATEVCQWWSFANIPAHVTFTRYFQAFTKNCVFTVRKHYYQDV